MNYQTKITTFTNLLLAAVPADAGTQEHEGWLTCHALNEIAGIKKIPLLVAELVSAFSSFERAQIASDWSDDADLVSALGYQTPYNLLRNAGFI